MPDIWMCPSKTCPKRLKCYRSPASGTKPDKYCQSWFFHGEDFDEATCEHFMERWTK